jgi:hypothetical protein
MGIGRLNLVFLVVVCGGLFRNFIGRLYVLNFENFKVLLLTTVVVLSCSPIVIKLSSDFPVLLLLISFEHKWMLKKLGPSKSLIRCLVEKALKERLELW